MKQSVFEANPAACLIPCVGKGPAFNYLTFFTHAVKELLRPLAMNLLQDSWK